MSQIVGRALHHVFKIGNRKATMDFYREILGMKVRMQFIHVNIQCCCVRRFNEWLMISIFSLNSRFIQPRNRPSVLLTN